MSRFFGHYALCKCLHTLGFTPEKQVGSSHVKFTPPKDHIVPSNLRPFIIVILNTNEYSKHTCSRYVTEIVQLGFNRNTVKKLLYES
jgi:hypothetical protein